VTSESDASSGVSLDSHESRPMKVVQRDVAADHVVTLVLEPTGSGLLPRWEPGAHVDLLLENGLERQFSLCGDPKDQTRWRVAVLREQMSRGGSSFIHDYLHEGDVVEVRGPRNNFDLIHSDSYLFIAGGIGITPILPMLFDVAQRGADFELVYSGRTLTSMAFVDEVSVFNERASIRPKDQLGRVDIPALLSKVRPGTLVYCCGPEGLLQEVERASAHWPVDSLHLERFAPKPDEGHENHEFEVVLNGSDETHVIPADKTILGVLSEAGHDLYFSCTEGTCGTCETPVIEGEIDHRDSVLSRSEQERGDVMMICVSRCRGKRLVLDL